MRCFWTSTCLFVVFASAGPASTWAQAERSSQEGQSSQSGQSSRRDESRDSSRSGGDDAEYRLRYDDERDRLSIDVDEDIRVRDDRRAEDSQDYARDARVDLQYDSDRHDLQVEGGGTVDVDRAGADLARWWESWWQEEERSRRSAREGMESGARAFLRQHDDNDDGYVARQELPQSRREEFSHVDRNRDGYLSRSELERFGADVYNFRRERTARTDSASQRRNSGEQTWSEWWSSWWSDDDQDSQGGAEELLRRYDRNDDNYLSRSELPQSMRDDFASVDRNDDDYLSRTEIRSHGDALRDEDYRRTARRDSGSRSSGEQTWSQWWNSWLEGWDGDSREGREGIAGQGAREFIRRHDENNDGYLVRGELPPRMHDDFDRLDANDDSYATRSEIERHAQQFVSRDRSQGRRLSDGRQPVELTYVWIIDASQGAVSRKDLQQAYQLLARIDENGDQQISDSELHEQREQIASDWTQNRFESLDRNGDDRLSESEAQDSLLGRHFDQFDRNQNGSLTRDELRQTLEERFTSRGAESSRR